MIINLKIKTMKNQKLWDSLVKVNNDPYGKCCVDVAHRVMELLDNDNKPLHDGYYPDINTPHGLICQADNDIDAGGITGFMAGCVANMVSQCHERGEEFRRIWNKEYKGNGTINPAVIEVDL